MTQVLRPLQQIEHVASFQASFHDDKRTPHVLERDSMRFELVRDIHVAPHKQMSSMLRKVIKSRPSTEILDMGASHVRILHESVQNINRCGR